MIVLKHTLKFIEIVLTDGNDFEISEFYRIQTFSKSRKMVRFFLEISNFLENRSGGAPALRVSRAVTLTVHRLLPKQ